MCPILPGAHKHQFAAAGRASGDLAAGRAPNAALTPFQTESGPLAAAAQAPAINGVGAQPEASWPRWCGRSQQRRMAPRKSPRAANSVGSLSHRKRDGVRVKASHGSAPSHSNPLPCGRGAHRLRGANLRKLPPHTLQLLSPLLKTIGNNGWATRDDFYTCRLPFCSSHSRADATWTEAGSRAPRLPRISSRVFQLRAAVVQPPVNNRPETGSPRRASFSTATGWSLPSQRRSSS